MSIRFIIPAKSSGQSLDSVLHEILIGGGMNPFEPVLVKFVCDFAKSILLDKRARNFPELVVLANFFKASNIAKLKVELNLHGASFRMPRGLVFHIAPSNVDSVFLYSSLLSFLCGNINLIRISRPSGEQLQFVLEKLAILFESTYQELANRFFIITYEHDDEITSLISTYCHMRVLWGGDATVKKIRSLPLRPMASEICFPDRFSIAMLNANSVLNVSNLDLIELCNNFYNDSIWFSQQACSSPRLVVWIGNQQSCQLARQKFWNEFGKLLLDKSYENSPGMSMDRYVAACIVSCSSAHLETSALGFPTRVLLDNVSLANLKPMHCGNGLFYEQYFESIPDFFQTLTASEQTLAVFGFDSNELMGCLHNIPMRAIDRVTKIGNALDFNYVWDGYNLLHSFTRQIGVHI